MIAGYVDRLNNIYDGTWAYTYTVHDKRRDEVRVRRVNPAEADYRKRDVLLAINGQAPSARRLAQHERMLQRRERQRLRDGTRLHEDSSRPNERPGREKERFMAMLIPESLELLKQEGDLLYLGFEATEEGREHIFEHLDGLLVVDTGEQYIRELQLVPTGPFHPFFLTKVEDAFLSVRFGLVEGEPIQQAATWKLLGQALIFKNLDADLEAEWKDFDRVVPHTGEATPETARDAL